MNQEGRIKDLEREIDAYSTIAKTCGRKLQIAIQALENIKNPLMYDGKIALKALEEIRGVK